MKKAAENRKFSLKVEEAALGNSAAVERSGDMRKNDNKDINTTHTKPKTQTCKFFMKIGRCRSGERC
eukprot:12928814-Prorocentrum_lima.AAC.1